MITFLKKYQKYYVLYSFITCFLCIGIVPVYSQIYAQNEDLGQIKVGKFVFILPQNIQKAVQTYIKLLEENKTLLQTRIALAQEFLPLIETILKKNNLPTDYKYLALIDNGEGNFWNFAQNRNWKLQKDAFVDENFNIVSLTERFVDFCKKIAPTPHLEWVSLIAFVSPNEDWQTYLDTHFKDLIKSAKPENTTIELPNEVPEILLKFFAHKVVFAPRITADNYHNTEWVVEKTKDKNLSQLANYYGVELKRLKKANNWLKTDKIPADKLYPVLIPVFIPSPTNNVETEKTRGMHDDYEVNYVYPDDYDMHVVKQGEGVFAIARLHKISAKDVMEWNNLTSNSTLKVGQKLKISKTTHTEDKQINKANTDVKSIIHLVQEKETFYSISTLYKVTIGQIKSWNPITSEKGLKIGQELTIYTNNGKVTTPKNKKEPSSQYVSAPKTKRYKGIKDVPDYITILGERLKLDKDAKAEIQKRVSILMKNPNYYLDLYDRKVAYENLIQESLKNEGMHPDFMYLAIQESALNGKAVSSSQAVGYWQMKVDISKEMKLIMDSEVDERMHIINSTIAASKYFKRNRLAYGGSWFKAILGYQMGFNGAKRFFEKNEFLKNNTVTKNTPVYIQKFIAHKIAFLEVLDSEHVQKLTSIMVSPGTDIDEIAQEQRINISELHQHNPWLKGRDRTPKNRSSVVIVPEK